MLEEAFGTTSVQQTKLFHVTKIHFFKMSMALCLFQRNYLSDGLGLKDGQPRMKKAMFNTSTNICQNSNTLKRAKILCSCSNIQHTHVHPELTDRMKQARARRTSVSQETIGVKFTAESKYATVCLKRIAVISTMTGLKTKNIVFFNLTVETWFLSLYKPQFHTNRAF